MINAGWRQTAALPGVNAGWRQTAALPGVNAGWRQTAALPGVNAEGDGGLFDGVLAAGGVRAEVADRAWLLALLDAEAGLAAAAASVGLIPVDDARVVADACTALAGDPAVIAAIGAEAAATGTPVVPLISRLRASVPESAARAVHLGATSQDIVDTAAMLVAHRALGPLLADLGAAVDATARLAERHRDTRVIGRTLLQRAAPTMFGLVAAGWLSGLDWARRRLAEVRSGGLAVQLGGAVGNLAAYGDRGPAMVSAYAAALGLAEPELPWHTERTRIADLAGALGSASGALGKVARDITLYAQTEVGELAEGGDEGGSSAMPHKHNPIRAISAAAAAAQAPGLVATLLAATPHEYQRAAGAWHAEWRPMRALLESTGSAAYQLRRSLDGVVVDVERMRANLGADAPDPDASSPDASSQVTADPRVAELLITRALESAHRTSGDLGLVTPDKSEVSRYSGDHNSKIGAFVEADAGAAGLAAGGVVRVHYRVDGLESAPALLMINSLGADLRMWDPQIPALAARRRVIRYDARGHGRSPVPDGRYSLADLGRDALALLDHLGIASADICGLSLGGMTAMWLAVHAPERVNRLVLCCTSALFGPARQWADRAATVRAHGTSAVAESVVARWLTPGYAAAHPDTLTYLREMVAATPAAGYAGACAAIEEMDLRADLPRIAAKTLVIAGADDPATPPEHGEVIAAGIPRAHLEIVDDAAHLATYQQAEAVNRLIVAALDDDDG